MGHRRGRRMGMLTRVVFVLAGMAGSATMATAPAWAYGPTPPQSTPQDAPTTHATSAATAPVSSGGLAFTGTDTALLSAIGAGAIGAGGAILLVSRRRRQASAG